MSVTRLVPPNYHAELARDRPDLAPVFAAGARDRLLRDRGRSFDLHSDEWRDVAPCQEATPPGLEVPERSLSFNPTSEVPDIKWRRLHERSSLLLRASCG
jgi:hypothetical protein